jgi:hypothetical protein
VVKQVEIKLENTRTSKMRNTGSGSEKRCDEKRLRDRKLQNTAEVNEDLNEQKGRGCSRVGRFSIV